MLRPGVHGGATGPHVRHNRRELTPAKRSRVLAGSMYRERPSLPPSPPYHTGMGTTTPKGCCSAAAAVTAAARSFCRQTWTTTATTHLRACNNKPFYDHHTPSANTTAAARNEVVKTTRDVRDSSRIFTACNTCTI